MIMDNQKTTSKTTLLKLLLMRAWKERWTDCQWGINVKTVLTRGVSGDVYNLADCILQQAVVGSGANSLFLSYLKHSLCAHLISHAAVLKRISKYERFEMHHCLVALLEFLESIIGGVTCRGKQEEGLLTKAMLSLVYWLMQIYENAIESYSEHRSLTTEQQLVVDKMVNVLEKIVQSQFLLGVVYVSKYEDPELFAVLTKKCIRIDNLTASSGFVPPVGSQKNVTVNDYIRKVGCIDADTLEMKAFDGRCVEPITYCLQPLIAIDILFNPNCDTQTYVTEFLMLQTLKGYSLSRLYCEIIRACLTCLNNVSGTSRESYICAFTFIKVPQILRQIHLQSRLLNPADFDDAKLDYSTDVVEAFELLLQDSPILDFMDAKCACNTVECLLNEMVKHHLINEKFSKVIAAKRDMITSGMQQLDLNTSQHSIVKFVFRAEPPLVGILKTLSSDYNKVQEALLGMLCQVLSGNSFELILSVATVEGKLKTFVAGLIKCNESSKQVPGEIGKPALTRAALFDVSFLMLVFIVQNYGSDVVPDGTESFFEKWVRECMVEKHTKSKSAMNMVKLCDPNKVDELIISLNSPDGLKATSLKWQEIAANIPGLLYQVLLAWENETLSTGEIKKFLDSLKARFCCFSICAASWLCAYMQIIRQDELLKPMNMIQQFLTNVSPEDLLQQEYMKERLGLMVQIIRKMQQDFQRMPVTSPKMRTVRSDSALHTYIRTREQAMSFRKLMFAAVTWSLCLFYSVRVLFYIAVQFFTKPHSKFWVVKKRPYPPQCLQKHDYGVNKLITVNGVKLHYVEKGDPSKPLMVLVHGFPEFWFSWRYQLKEFSKDYWVVAVDMRGYGESDKPNDLNAYRVANMVQDIKELVTALGRKKFTLVGHDWGAAICWDFIAQHMDMLDKYIMMDAPSREVAFKLIKSTKEQFKMSWYMFFFQMPKLPEFFVRMNDLKMFDISLGKYCTPEEVEAFKYTFSKKGALTPPINYYRANFATSSKGSPKPPKDIPHVPGLYLLGEKDFYISKATGKMLQERFNNLDFKIVQGAGHFVQQHKPDLVNKLMRDFLEKK